MDDAKNSAIFLHASLTAALACLLLLPFAIAPRVATAQPLQSQYPPKAAAQNPDSQIVTSASTPADDDLPAPPHDPKASPEKKAEEAWSMLTISVTDPKHTDLRI